MRTRLPLSILSLSLHLLLLASVLPAAAAETAPLLSAEIRGNDNRQPQFGKRIHNEMHFILTARAKLVKVFQEWCSWGHDTRSFTATDVSSTSSQYSFTKRSKRWTRNIPATHEIKPGEFLVTAIDFCNGNWRVSPKLPKQTIMLRLVGRLVIEPDEETKNLSVWTGELQTNTLEVMIMDDCIDLLNAP